MRCKSLGRRDFLKAGGALVVTFAVGAAPSRSIGAVPAKTVALDQVDGFLAIDANGGVTVYSGKVDLGTGIRTAMAQIAAEELSVPLVRDRRDPGRHAAHARSGHHVRQPVDTERRHGRSARRRPPRAMRWSPQAATHLGVVSVMIWSIDERRRSPEDRAARASSYAQLDRRPGLPAQRATPRQPLKDPKDYTIVGKPIPRLDIPDKVNGRFTYMQDFKPQGHAARTRDSAAGDESDAAVVERFRLPADSRLRRRRPQRQFPRRARTHRVVGDQECAAPYRATWSDWQGLPDRQKLWEYVRGTKVKQGRGSAESRQQRRSTEDARARRS